MKKKVAYNIGDGVIRIGVIVGHRNHPIEDMCGVYQFKIKRSWYSKPVWVNWWHVWDGDRLNKAVRISLLSALD